MHVVVTGATGNVGTSVLRALAADDTVTKITGLARRSPSASGVLNAAARPSVPGAGARPDESPRPGDSSRTGDISEEKVRWVEADITEAGLAESFTGADVIVHLAWLIQPSRDIDYLWRVNVAGTDHVLRAAVAAGAKAVVVASSVGAYSPADKSSRVTEDWPTHGIPTSSYSMAKAYVERMLDTFSRDHPDIRVVRLRPALLFKREAASEIRRFFAGGLLPPGFLGRIPVSPAVAGGIFQALHTDDVAQAYRLAIVRDVKGAFNVAAEPVLDLQDVARALGARAVTISPKVLRAGATVTYRLRLHPVDAGWVDLALKVPILDTTRARQELGWEPRTDARATLAELLSGMNDDAGAPTPALRPGSLLSRAKELATGQGARHSRDPRT